MKIDLHTHTKQCKEGDAPTRAISPEAFCETVMATEVGIIGITNHNVFDLDQYKDIKAKIGDDTQVWPGIELDVIYEGSRGHLLVLVSPSFAEQFSNVVERLTNKSTPDDFTTTIDHILDAFDSLGPLYVGHYKQKTPNLSDEALQKLIDGTDNPARVIKEVTNSISAGIYISHGHPSIYGSDVHDWSTYEEQARDLPDLRLPVESFEHFCLLLEKDPTTINTALDQKESEDLKITPFEDETELTLKVYNDINVLFGPKGTGKSCILQAIARYYSDRGIEARVFESASDRLGEMYDIKGQDLSLNLNAYSINYCKTEIEELRHASEVGVTSLSKYIDYFRIQTTNKNANKIKLRNIDPKEEGPARRGFEKFHESVERTATYLDFISQDEAINEELTQAELNSLISTLSNLITRLKERERKSYSEWKEIFLLNSAIHKFRIEIQRKTGSPAKPTTTGFRHYAMNRAKIAANAASIIANVDTAIPRVKERVGSIGASKGVLEFCTEFKFQDGNVTDSQFHKLKNVKKTSSKSFIRTVREIYKNAYRDRLFQSIANLNSIEDVEDIETVYELLLYKRYFALDGTNYSPSSGEASMVMLQKELESDRDVYILDEPERSLGNDYINDLIVPLIKERARAGKKLFISTHDANIAVRTLPYSSIYRCHDSSGYSTYAGNPFSNHLINLNDANDHLNWKTVSMNTLEGGEVAFGERGKIYGYN